MGKQGEEITYSLREDNEEKQTDGYIIEDENDFVKIAVVPVTDYSIKPTCGENTPLMYECTQGFKIPVLDDEEVATDEYMTVTKGSVWLKYWDSTIADYRLDSNTTQEYIHVTEERLQQHFKEMG